MLVLVPGDEAFRRLPSAYLSTRVAAGLWGLQLGTGCGFPAPPLSVLMCPPSRGQWSEDTALPAMGQPGSS